MQDTFVKINCIGGHFEDMQEIVDIMPEDIASYEELCSSEYDKVQVTTTSQWDNFL